MSAQTSIRPDSAMEMAQLEQQVLQIQQENVALEKASTTAPGHDVAKELDFARAQLLIVQQENLELKSLHEEYGCPELMFITQRDTLAARQLQESAEAETMGYRHLHEANKLMQTQMLTSQKLLNEATRALRLRDAEVASLQRTVEGHRKGQMDAEDKVAGLEDELLRYKPRELNFGLSINDMFANVPETRYVTDYRAAPEQQDSEQHFAVDANLGSDATSSSASESSIIIKIDSSQPAKWNLVKRVHAAMAQDTKLDVQGPPELVASLVSGMRTAHTDHEQKAAAAEHWQKVANDALAKIDIMRTNVVAGPTCTVPGHRNLVDELAAKDAQLEMQKQLVECWQGNVSRVKDAMDQAGSDLRAQGVRGVR